MQVSQKCIDLVKRYEGFISKTYVCPAGYKTIGFGHRTDEITTITEPEAENLLKKDLKKFEQGLCKMLNAEELNVTKGEKAHGFNRGMIAPKMCVYNLNKHLQIYYNVRYEERIQTHKNDCILN